MNIFNNKYFEGAIARLMENKTEEISYAKSSALRAYEQTKKYELDTYTVQETPFSQDMGEFMKLVDGAGITEFNLCEKSSGLMSVLHCLLNNGWVVAGTYEKQIDRYTTFHGLNMKKI